MRKLTKIMSAMGLAMALSAGYVYADEVVYGSQLMTQQERVEYRAKLRNAKTYQEREQIRLEHHKAMQARARSQGMTLPDMPPAMGGGMGPAGGGMGPGGGGAGPGAGRGR